MNALITDEQRIVLLANGRESLENPDFDPAPVVKLFTPDAGATWRLTEIDADDHDHAFGLCDLGLGMPEIGWVSLSELATVRGRLGLPVERDLHFRAEGILKFFLERADIAVLRTHAARARFRTRIDKHFDLPDGKTVGDDLLAKLDLSFLVLHRDQSPRMAERDQIFGKEILNFRW